MKREGHLVLRLRAGVPCAAVPAHLDCLTGAGRPCSALDAGRVDAAVSRWGGAGRYRRVYHARRSLGRPGEHHVGFDDTEESFGLSRSFQLQIARPEGARDLLHALRDLDAIEECTEQTLATAPLDEGKPRRVSAEAAFEPYRRVRAAEALRREPGDASITVAVVDTGIVVGHPEFQRRCLAGYDTVDLGMGRLNPSTHLLGDSRGWDYNPYDEVGHGCLVAGIIGARGWRVPRGLAGRAMLLPVRVLAAARRSEHGRSFGVGALPDIDAGIKVAVDLGAQVMNLSLGSPLDDHDTRSEPPHQAVARYATQRGCVLIAAAGNSGQRQRFYPAALPEVIAVGSVDREGRRSRFSTWGPHVALCAPGEAIAGVGRRGYQMSSGTSFASPYVAAAAALLLAHAHRRGRRLAPPQVRELLCATAQRLPGGPNEETGAGLLDCVAALEALDTLERSPSPASHRVPQ